jgi:hypothetical protein
LYYTAFSNRWLKFATFMIRLRGKDPTRWGRNKDIDMTQIGADPGLITTRIDYRKFWDVKLAASAQHTSQGGGTSFTRLLPDWLQKQVFGFDAFIRAYPPSRNGRHEQDLF